MRARLLLLVIALLRPFIRRMRTRSALLERVLQLGLQPGEAASVATACRMSGRSLGEYYLWKLDQLSVIAAVKSLPEDATLALVRDADRTDYAALLEAPADRGLLVAAPHHGHFVLSIIGIIEAFRGKRPVYVFYDSPEEHGSNAIFDMLYGRLYGEGNGHVAVLHNNRQGLARALKELQRGSVVVIMPDVFKDVHDTYQMPVFGYTRNVMLGTAILARRTGASILPAVSIPSADRLAFSTAFGQVIEPVHPGDEEIAAGLEAEATVHADYRTTAALFAAYEPLMGDGLIYWQYSRSHFSQTTLFTRLAGDELESACEMFFKDPRVRVDLSAPIPLD